MDIFPKAVPLVSIILPTYNISRYVNAAIDSALAQTYSNIEIVVVDDGSTDNTPDIVRAYGEKVRFFRRDENKGITTTLNEGVGHARGDYILFFDADDVFKPDAIERTMACVAKNPGVDFVYFRMFIFYDNEGIEKTYHYKLDYLPKLDGSDFSRLLIRGDMFKFSQVMMRRSMFQGEGAAKLDTSLKYAGDWDLWLQLLAANRHGVFCDEILFYCRVHEHGLSSSLRGKWGGKREGFLLIEKWKKTAVERGASASEIANLEDSLKIKILFNVLGDPKRAEIFKEVKSWGLGSQRVRRWYAVGNILRFIVPWQILNKLETQYYNYKQRSVSLPKTVDAR